MVSPYGKWLQKERDISNPYMGSRMPRCGSHVRALGGGERGGKDDGKESGHGDAAYACPMHSDVTAAEPGKCSKCGMALRKQ